MPTTYYEVAWGIEHGQQQTWEDHGDGSGASDHTEALANRLLIDLYKNGVKAGLWVNGRHVDGYDFAEEWAQAEAADQAALSHKTTTFLDDHSTHMNWRKVQVVGSRMAWAKCTCGWKKLCDNREIARLTAKRHREEVSA